ASLSTLFPYTTLFRSRKQCLKISLGLAALIYRVTIVFVADVFQHFPRAVAPEGVAEVPGLRQHIRIFVGEVEMEDVRVVLVEVRSEEHTSELQSRENL